MSDISEILKSNLIGISYTYNGKYLCLMDAEIQVLTITRQGQRNE